jgi:hypothetical protein
MLRIVPAQPGSVGKLSLALYHRWQPDQFWVQVTAYIDESGTHNADVMTLGGLVGRLGQWTSFDAKWNKLLKKEGIPYFHLKSFKGDDKPFRDKKGRSWSADRKDRVLKEVDRIIHRNTLFGFTIALKASDFSEIYLPGDKPRKARLDSKYGLCFRMCLSMVPDLVQAAFPNQDIDLYFVLENGAKNIGDAFRVFDEFKKRGPKHIAKILRTATPGEKVEFPGLQGADIPAHLSFVSESKDAPPVIDLQKPAAEMLAHKSRWSRTPIFRSRFTEENLREARSNAIEEVTRRLEYWHHKKRKNA